MPAGPHILVVDDDPQIGELIRDYLTQHGYQVSVAANGREMWRVFKQKSIDVVILDVMLPGDDGVSLCRQLREVSSVSIIMLSAAAEESDRIVGLEVGADDYLTKPFSPRELLARLKALLRRSSGDLGKQRQQQALANLPSLQFAGWTLDRKQRQLIAEGNLMVPLTTGEYDLLCIFLQHPQQVLSRDQLLDLTHGRQAGPYDRSIDVQVGRLRKKIEKDAKNPQLLLTIRGGGYQLQVQVKQKKA